MKLSEHLYWIFKHYIFMYNIKTSLNQWAF
jgi:hypothetical protein